MLIDPAIPSVPAGPLISFYGDDFTGSSAVMEVLSFAGVPTMLFLEPPDPSVLSAYPGLRAVGVAGIARSKDPDWMRAKLPVIFEALRALGAPVCHYKVCSTFDSAPGIGSIGVALDLGAEALGAPWVPLVVGAPEIGRYQAFGTLFAAAGAAVHRLDRHPVMARHPVTPMAEADLGRHLSVQTALKTGVVDLAAMKSGAGDAALGDVLASGARIVAIDVVDQETLSEAGRLIWQDGAGGIFAVGSQGVEYALVAHWRSLGELEPQPAQDIMTPVGQLFAVSGSCSPTTAEQIAYARGAGFEILSFDAAAAVDAERLRAETARVLENGCERLAAGQDVLVATAQGPDDPALARMTAAIAASGLAAGAVNEALGRALGELVVGVRRRAGVGRVVIAGGDTSSHALTACGAEALSAVAPLAPGAPLCRVHSRAAPEIDGLEVALKGGQMGGVAFFAEAKGRIE